MSSKQSSSLMRLADRLATKRSRRGFLGMTAKAAAAITTAGAGLTQAYRNASADAARRQATAYWHFLNDVRISVPPKVAVAGLGLAALEDASSFAVNVGMTDVRSLGWMGQAAEAPIAIRASSARR